MDKVHKSITTRNEEVQEIDVFSAVTMKITVFLDVTPCIMRDIYQSFGGNAPSIFRG
jgi:hypothetical protein